AEDATGLEVPGRSGAARAVAGRESGLRGLNERAGYGNRTRLTGLGSQGITTMLSPRQPRSYQDLMKASTSSRFCAISSGVTASRLSRSIGSVFEPRTLKCQSGNSADTPSIV